MKQGFALLITVTLLAFLVLLLVSLAALTRVETAVAANTQVASRAREHALMALNVALGQLQAHAGPDSRVTAQANVLGANVGNPWFTGVWTADEAGAPVQRTWLVSGNETNALRFGPSSVLGREGPEPEIALTVGSDGLAVNGPESGEPNRVRLVGVGSAGATGTAMAHGGVVVPGVPLNATVPGFSGERTIGRYAWWVGDQGVKASLALADRADDVTYAPWETLAQRRRIRQQIATAPTFFRRWGGAEDYGFDPLVAENVPLLARVLEREHVELLTPAVATAPLSTFRRQHFHAFTDRAYGVLANTLPMTSAKRGLLRDLSLEPGMLGAAFAAQADLASHLEAPAAANTAVPPIATADSERRRHRVTAPVASAATADDPAIEFKVAPVLNSFLLQFRFFRGSASAGPLQVRSRMFVEMWNPYSSALVPEALTLEISGMPTVQVKVGAGVETPINLANLPSVIQAADSPTTMRVGLPVGTGAQADHKSWLPGRVYAWGTNTGSAPAADLRFYNKLLTTGWTYPPTGLTVARFQATDSAGNPVVDNDTGNPVMVNDTIRVESSSATVLTVRVKNAAGAVLATYTSPDLPEFAVEDANDSEENWAFGLAFRLQQPSAYNRDRHWLTVAGRDFRSAQPSVAVWGVCHENLGFEPTSYGGDFNPGDDSMMNYAIFRRASTGASEGALRSTRSANLDLPVFELPRLPYLSVGELQHLTLPELRPFAAGNAWGGAANTWFDRFFFSGLTVAVVAGGGPDLAAGQPLPNWNLQPLTTTVVEGGALSARHLLQAGAFNVNSALSEAWRAVLSGVRFGGARSFARANIENGSVPGGDVTIYTGSQPDPTAAGGGAVATVAEVFNDTTLDKDASVAAGKPVGGPAFFRFPQTAQETYYWADTAIEGDFKKQVFRQGVRGGAEAIDGSTLHTLTTEKVAELAEAIVRRVRERVATDGPFVSMEAFLAPNAAWGGRNVLGQAIEDAGINPASIALPKADGTVSDVKHFGLTSLTLTSADIMTALAPYFRTRSDTFVVRAYGEALNPANQEVEGRAWCEAVVQRMPTPADPAETNVATPAAGGFGRDFRILQFRWLTPSDI